MSDSETVVGVVDIKGVKEMAYQRSKSCLDYYAYLSRKDPTLVLFQCTLTESQLDIIKMLAERYNKSLEIMKALVQFSVINVDKSRKDQWIAIRETHGLSSKEELVNG